MIRVLHIIPGLSVGGTEMMLYKLLAARASPDIRHEVICMAGRGEMGPRIASLGIPVHYLDIPLHGLSAVGAISLLKAIRRATPDIVQGWTYHGSLVASIVELMRSFGNRRIAYAWNIRCARNCAGLKLRTRAVAWLLPYLPRQPQVIVNNSRSSAREHAALGYRMQRTVVIPNGFDCERFRPMDHAGRRLRNELGVEQRTTLVGMVARYDVAKDFDNFVRAAAMVGAAVPDVHFVLIGPNVDGSNRELVASIDRTAIPERFHLMGGRDDVANLMAGFDVFCSSSISEGFPNVIGEAMACAVPCVATDAGDSAWLLGDTGIVTPVGNPMALSAGLHRMLEMPNEERRRRGERGRQRILERFSLATIVRSYEDLYLKLVS